MADGRVFISYSRQDSDFALRLARDLRASKIDIWIDQLDLIGGPDWRHQVQKELELSPRMIVILSPDSAASRYVRSEWTYLLDNPAGEPDLIPVLYRDCQVPFGLHSYQRIPFTQDYENAFESLLISLGISKDEREGQLRELLARSRDGAKSLASSMPARGFNREEGPAGNALQTVEPDQPSAAAIDPGNDQAVSAVADQALSATKSAVDTAAGTIAGGGSTAGTTAATASAAAATTAAATGSAISASSMLAAGVLVTAVGVGTWQYLEQDSAQPEPTSGTMQITGTPANADIYLPGNQRFEPGRKYDFGTYQITARASGYEPESLSVNHRSADTRVTFNLEREPEREPEPELTAARMNITTNPSGADIRMPDGTGFNRNREYAFGTYTVSVSADGYYPEQRTVNHRSGSTALNVSLQQKPISGRIIVNTTPSNANVSMANGSSFNPNQNYNFGTYEITVSADGYQSKTESIKHQKNGTSTIITLDELVQQSVQPDPPVVSGESSKGSSAPLPPAILNSDGG